MIQFIDIRNQGTGSRFAFWDTVTDRFLTISTEMAWDTWSDIEGLEDVVDKRIDSERLKRICPDWVHNGKEG